MNRRRLEPFLAALSNASLLQGISQDGGNLPIENIDAVGRGIALTDKIELLVRNEPLDGGFHDGGQHVADECRG